MAHVYTVQVKNPEGVIAYSENFPSVTQIIDTVVAKPQLPDWYYRETVKGFSALVAKYGGSLPSDLPSLHSLLSTEGGSPYTIRDAAKDGGSRIHRAVEVLAGGRSRTKVAKDFPALVQWWEKTGITKDDVLACETTVVSFSAKYAGTVDLIVRNWPVAEGATLIDIKSGNFRWEHCLQVEAYKQAWEEMGGERISSQMIVQVPRDGSPVKEHQVPPETGKSWWAVLEIYEDIPKKWNPEKGVFA